MEEMMDSEISRGWLMFLSHLQNAADEDQRHAYTLIERDRIHEGLHDREIRQRVEDGQYGRTAQEMWGHFKSAID